MKQDVGQFLKHHGQKLEKKLPLQMLRENLIHTPQGFKKNVLIS